MFHGWYEKAVVVIGKISQSAQLWCNSSAQGSKQKVTEDIALSFPMKTQGRWDSEMHKQVVNDELHLF